MDPINDFTPIARLGGTNFFLVVRSSFPAKTMREWIDEVKRNPGKYRYASAGIGTPHHIFMELLKKQFSLEITHVPYKGSVEAMPDLLAGRVDMAFLDGSQAVSHIKSGELQALGTTMAKQTDLVEGVPPIAATVPSFDWSGWIMIAGPRGMPKPVVARIAAQVAELQATPLFTGSPAQLADGSHAAVVAGSNRSLRTRRIRTLETGDQTFRRRRVISDFPASTRIDPMNHATRRVVTGHDDNGKAIIESDGPAPNVRVREGAGFVCYLAVGHRRDAGQCRAAHRPRRPHHRGGAAGERLHSADRRLSAGYPRGRRDGRDGVAAGDGRRSWRAGGAPSRHAYMHRTKSVDYGIVLSGEIDMLLDDSEVHLKAGDIVIQQATNHAWVNRSSDFCRIAFILIDAHDPLAKKG